MRAVKIAVFGDGAHELRGISAGSGVANETAALCRLVARIAGAPDHIEYVCIPFKKAGPVHGKAVNDFSRKTKGALFRAKREGCQGAVILIDRDRKPDSQRVKALREGRDALGDVLYPPCAVGTAIETFDAWMIVDGKAIGAAGGNASIPYGEPEKLGGTEGTGKHPKDRAIEIFGGAGELPEKYAAVADSVDIDMLKKQCPKGFKPFAEEVEQRVAPLVKS